MIYPKSAKKTQNKKEHTLYIPKGNIKKSNKIKKRCWQGEQDMLLSYCRKAGKWKLKSNLKLKSKWDSDIWITTPLKKWILKSISRWEIKNWNQYLDNHPCGGVVNG